MFYNLIGFSLFCHIIMFHTSFVLSHQHFQFNGGVGYSGSATATRSHGNLVGTRTSHALFSRSLTVFVAFFARMFILHQCTATVASRAKRPARDDARSSVGRCAAPASGSDTCAISGVRNTSGLGSRCAHLRNCAQYRGAQYRGSRIVAGGV